jgi:hypothetical protein
LLGSDQRRHGQRIERGHDAGWARGGEGARLGGDQRRREGRRGLGSWRRRKASETTVAASLVVEVGGGSDGLGVEHGQEVTAERDDTAGHGTTPASTAWTP